MHTTLKPTTRTLLAAAAKRRGVVPRGATSLRILAARKQHQARLLYGTAAIVGWLATGS